jgi:hypothetical protein
VEDLYMLSNNKHYILGIHISDRLALADEVQKIFTEYGCNIKTRVGFHDVSESYCSPTGVIVLDMFGEEAVCEQMAGRLEAIEGVEVQKMIFTHPRLEKK